MNDGLDKFFCAVASHFFATILIRGGSPMKLISQRIGHLKLYTKERYFAGFNLQTQAEMQPKHIGFTVCLL